jgi:NAD(P)H-quinone oxidoreductase subunit 5
MPLLSPWLVLLAPSALVMIAALPDRSSTNPRGARRFAGLAITASTAALGVALAAALALAISGPLRSATLGWRGVGLAVAIDPLSSIMLLLVSFVGLVVIRFSRNYLDGDPGHIRFTRWLLLTLAAVLTLIVSANLAQLIAAWIATSFTLNRLLLFYGSRPAAVRAARKKFVASRIGDLCLIGAALLLYANFATLDIAELSAAAKSAVLAGEKSAIVTAAACLIVVTALLKSAQLPMHGWLLEVMETPTPVSAILHAGIINAGGFLVLRLAELLVLAAPSLQTLAIIGGVTALFASLVMLTQTSVKVQLAYSTIAQMGFMLLQCGLGAFSSALLHIVAHSLYKAHAFLASGSIMDLARASWTPSPGGKPHSARLVFALLAVIALAFAVTAMFGLAPGNHAGRWVSGNWVSGHLVLAAILLTGLVHLLANAIDQRPNAYVLGRIAATAVVVAAIYFGLQAAMAWFTAGCLPLHRDLNGALDRVIAALVVLCFAALTVFQNRMAVGAGHPFWDAAYVHIRHGLYLNTLANRLVLRFWLRRRAAPLSSSANPITSL